MTKKEIEVLRRIPKRFKKHIINLTIRESGDYNSKGRERNNYTVTYDNGDKHTFQNQNYMIWMLKEYTDDSGYYNSP